MINELISIKEDLNPLVRLNLKNFRCFEDHTIEFSNLALLVGKNNAGKSSCIEALRLVSIITERQHGLNYKSPPEGLNLPRTWKGLQPGLASISVRRELIFHRYSDPPAIVTAYFKNGARIEVYIGQGLITHALTFDSNNKPVQTRPSFSEANIPRISILPQIGPLVPEETLLTETYVRANLFTGRGSLHFRNQLHFMSELVPEFEDLVSSTWPGLRIDELIVPYVTDRDNPISLLVRDDDFVAEVALMGHGLQMWLQTMWFLIRSKESDVVILDEPDVYMHADLQRRLIRLMGRDNRQCIIATHSPEMLAEVDPESIVVLDRKSPISKPATDSKAVQQLLDSFGSIHNLDLARLAIYNRLLLVEGDDVGILKLFQNVIDPSTDMPIDAIPNVAIEGWSNWKSVLTIADLFRKNIPNQIQIFCILDRDFRTEELLEKRRTEAEQAGIVLIIWEAKEIENYGLMPAAIARLINENSITQVTETVVEDQIKTIVNSLKNETIDTYSEVIRLDEKSSAKNSNPKARAAVEARWKLLDGRYVVDGKDVFKRLTTWSQSEFKTSLSIKRVIRMARPSEVHSDIKLALKSLTRSKNEF